MAFTRSHSLPPSEIKSLYGSITSRAVLCFSYVTLFIRASMVVIRYRLLRRGVRYSWRREMFPAGYELLRLAYDRPGKPPTEFPACRGNPTAPAWLSCELCS